MEDRISIIFSNIVTFLTMFLQLKIGETNEVNPGTTALSKIGIVATCKKLERVLSN